ncbi:MAG: hypothetical protein IKM67_03090 [Clostridia bacterium]|nr:hypothetical protein [Clostridia bacterium]MBR3865681.1 hypothetical protein [Clostridia bacterium]
MSVTFSRHVCAAGSSGAPGSAGVSGVVGVSGFDGSLGVVGSLGVTGSSGTAGVSLPLLFVSPSSSGMDGSLFDALLQAATKTKSRHNSSKTYFLMFFIISLLFILTKNLFKLPMLIL